VQKEYDCNNDMMTKYLAEVHKMEKFFDGFKVRYVPRLDNRNADHLAWIASSRALTPPDAIVERLSKPLVKSEASTSKTEPELMIIDNPVQQPAYDWMSLIRAYLDNRPSSDNNTEVERITRKSRMYHLIDGVLYREGANGMMMKCISREQGIELLEDIHKGVCGSHSSWRSMVGKAFRHGFYWPTAKDDAMEVMKNAEIASSSRSRQRNMLILFGLLISPGLLQFGESTSWASCPGLQVILDICLSELTHSLNG
jgi:hypothetical protein